MKNKFCQIASLSSDGIVKIIIGREEYAYYGVDTALYVFLNDRKPFQFLNIVKKNAKRVKKIHQTRR